MFSKVMNNIFYYNLNKDILNSRTIKLVISSEFVKKQEYKLKKIKRSIYVRNVNSSFKKKGFIEHMVKVYIYSLLEIQRKNRD